MQERLWRDCTFIAFDTETTGRYPLGAELCEIAAIKWRDGKIIGTFQTLIRPSRPMGQEVIDIHGITNEMVETAPSIRQKIGEFHEFIQDGVMIAHHAPFDLGFLSLEFEAVGLALPTLPVICTSLLSRAVIPESPDHRMKTLVQHLNLPPGTAHRAFYDAETCWEVARICMERMGDVVLEQILAKQGGPIFWSRFSMNEVDRTETGHELIRAIKGQKIVECVYGGGSAPGEARRLHPLGLVRSLDGDFVVAYCEKDQRSKRYFLDKVRTVKLVN